MKCKTGSSCGNTKLVQRSWYLEFNLATCIYPCSVAWVLRQFSFITQFLLKFRIMLIFNHSFFLLTTLWGPTGALYENDINVFHSAYAKVSQESLRITSIPSMQLKVNSHNSIELVGDYPDVSRRPCYKVVAIKLYSNLLHCQLAHMLSSVPDNRVQHTLLPGACSKYGFRSK